MNRELVKSVVPTEEQRQVIQHPDGHHGRVLSVAGSGKTMTMAFRIEHLMKERRVTKRQIQVLMFNHLARNQFMEKLAQLGISRNRQPQVNTFHSYAYRVANLKPHKQWFGEYKELADLELKRSISSVLKQHEMSEEEIDFEDAARAIDLWKGALIPPDRAGYSGPNANIYVAIYQEFEERRTEENAITFDDFVPLAVNLLTSNENALSEHAEPLRHIIVDEYQDINLGQQRLIELLASRGADVMVVGDDDQTIYEWRGARSEYILREFMETFKNKSHVTYRLSRSFRFGYSIAQTSYNVVTHNTNRNEKVLLAHDPALDSRITVVGNRSGDANRHLTTEIVSLVKKEGVSPIDIRVLGRTFSQLNSLSTEFLVHRVPFKVVGGSFFLEANECQVLLDYIRVAVSLDQPPDEMMDRRFLNIANKPGRYLARRDLLRMLQVGRDNSQSLRDLLDAVLRDRTKFARGDQKQKLEDLTSVLEEVDQKIRAAPQIRAETLLEWIDKEIKLQQHYENYYGQGEPSLVRTQNIAALKAYARHTALNWMAFIAHVDNIDTTQGRPETSWIKMTTIHRTKGLEFDYVFIPDCQEGFLPVLSDSDDPTYDKEQPKREPKAAEWIENERRLFYVGITRARKGLYIGAPEVELTEQPPEKNAESRGKARAIASRFLEEMELHQTQQIANELQTAARHEEGHRLAGVCRHLAAYHQIVGTVKEKYADFFTDKVRNELAAVKLSAAERPFTYKQRYIGRIPKKEPKQKDLDWSRVRDDIL